MGKVSGHSGLREEIELRRMEEKYNQVKTKRELQIKTIRSVLDPMPQAERRSFMAYIFSSYENGTFTEEEHP